MRHDLQHILDTTLKLCNVSQTEWEDNRKSRQGYIVRVRQITALIACEMEGYSLVEVGEFFGKHHATIISYIKTLKDQIDVYPGIQNLVDSVVARLDPLPQEELTMHGWLARSYTGLLTISLSRPEKVGGFWIAEKNESLPADQFPQITFESGPAKIKIKITLEKED